MLGMAILVELNAGKDISLPASIQERIMSTVTFNAYPPR
jgi:hypothetical protein